MDTMSRRSSGRIAAKKSLATYGLESLANANQGIPVAPNPEPIPCPPSSRVRGGNKRKAITISSPTGSHDKKLRRTITNTTEPKGAITNATETEPKDVITDTTEPKDAITDTTEPRDAITDTTGPKYPIITDTAAPKDTITGTEPKDAEPKEVITDTEPKDAITDISSNDAIKDIEPKDAIADATKPKGAAVDVSEAIDSPVKNGLDVEPGRVTERSITPRSQEHPEKPWVPPIIERRNPLVSRFESLVTPENFNLLSDEQKGKLHTLLPGFDREVSGSESSRLNGNLDFDALPSFWNDTRFRTQLSTIGERLEQGKYGQKFRDQIDSIMYRRANDEFLFMKDRAMESFWGQKKEIINPVLAGQAASIKLTTMARYHVIRVNDALRLRRQFVGYSLIEKYAIVTAIDQATGIMQLSYPPAQMRQSVAGVEDKIMHDVHSPGQIERILLEENGTGPEKPPNGNSFKNITVLRGGDDLGTLFFLRSQFFQVYLPPIEGAGPSAEGKKRATSRSLKASESSRLTVNTKSKSPVDETHPSNKHIDDEATKGEEKELVKKPTTRNRSPAVETPRSSPRRTRDKIAKNASPVGEMRPGDNQENNKALEEQKSPATRSRRAMRRR